MRRITHKENISVSSRPDDRYATASVQIKYIVLTVLQRKLAGKKKHFCQREGGAGAGVPLYRSSLPPRRGFINPANFSSDRLVCSAVIV